MTDREKVIKGLEYCERYFNCCDKCPYWDGGTHCTADLAHDALALLKEQEPKRAEWSTGRAHCPSCGELFPKKKDMTLYTRFCSFCGQKVKWE